MWIMNLGIRIFYLDNGFQYLNGDIDLYNSTIYTIMLFNSDSNLSNIIFNANNKQIWILKELCRHDYRILSSRDPSNIYNDLVLI